MIWDISVGDKYQISRGDIRGTFEVLEASTGEPIALRAESDGRLLHIKPIDLAILQTSGGAVRTKRQGLIVKSLTAFDLRSLHKPPKEFMSEKQLKEFIIRSADFARAARNLFYVRAFDRNPVSRSEDALNTFILGLTTEAAQAGFEVAPSASTLRKALKKGVSGERTLALYLRKRGFARLQTKWPEWVYILGQETVAHYWERSQVRFKDAYQFFDDKFYEKREEAIRRRRDELEQRFGTDGTVDEIADFADLVFDPPCHQTLSNWIHAARCHETIKSKYGLHQANRELRGRGQSVTAVAPLETIVLDQTLGDIWACEEVQVDGTTAIVLKRPWIVWAMDLYSRMIVGWVMTFDPPCIATLMACLRDVVSPNAALIERFGEAKGATDGWGKFRYLILDNALAHIGISLQIVGDIVGFEVDYAPIRTPEYKPWIERLVRTMNGALHTLPGGIPYPPEELEIRGINPRKGAGLTLE